MRIARISRSCENRNRKEYEPPLFGVGTAGLISLVSAGDAGDKGSAVGGWGRVDTLAGGREDTLVSLAGAGGGGGGGSVCLITDCDCGGGGDFCVSCGSGGAGGTGGAGGAGGGGGGGGAPQVAASATFPL